MAKPNKRIRKPGGQEKPPTQQQLKRRAIANKIAKELFTQGNGLRAGRLVFESKSFAISDSGWAEPVVADLIERQLQKFTLFYNQ